MNNTSYVFLRPFQDDDVFLINKWRNDFEIQSTTTGFIRPVSLEMEKRWIHEKMMDNTNNIYWAICKNDNTRRMIGYTSLNNINYVNGTSFGGGLVLAERDPLNAIAGFEAQKFVLDYAFQQLNLNKVGSYCLVEHRYSLNSARALGHKVEGRLRECVYKNGKYHDIYIFSILRKDYENLTAKKAYKIETLIRKCSEFSKEKQNKGFE